MNLFRKICTSDTIKLLGELLGKTFSDIKHTNVFLGQSPKAIEIKIRSVSQGNRNKNKDKQIGPNQTYELFAQ